VLVASEGGLNRDGDTVGVAVDSGHEDVIAEGQLLDSPGSSVQKPGIK
jgi:hypothetical protein